MRNTFLSFWFLFCLRSAVFNFTHLSIFMGFLSLSWPFQKGKQKMPRMNGLRIHKRFSVLYMTATQIHPHQTKSCPHVYLRKPWRLYTVGDWVWLNLLLNFISALYFSSGFDLKDSELDFKNEVWVNKTGREDIPLSLPQARINRNLNMVALFNTCSHTDPKLNQLDWIRIQTVLCCPPPWSET